MAQSITDCHFGAGRAQITQKERTIFSHEIYDHYEWIQHHAG